MYEWCLESAQRADDKESNFTLVFKEYKEYRVGRTIGFDIVSSNLLVSRNHCVITFKPDEKIYIRDLKSFNGTFVNDKRIESYKDILLRTDDLLGIGATSSVHIQKKDLFWVRRKQLRSISPELPHVSLHPIQETKKILQVLQEENNRPSTSSKYQKTLVNNKSTHVNISNKTKSEEISAKSNIENKNNNIKKEKTVYKESSNNEVETHVKSNSKNIPDENNINLKNTYKENGSVNNVIETETKIVENVKNDLTINKELIKPNLTTKNKTAEICSKKENICDSKIKTTNDEFVHLSQISNKEIEITENKLSDNIDPCAPSTSNQNRDLKLIEETPLNLDLAKTSNSSHEINKYEIDKAEKLEFENPDDSVDVKNFEINKAMGEIYVINSDDEMNYDDCVFVKQEIKGFNNHSFTQNDEDDIVLISDDEDIFPRSQLFEVKAERQEPTDTNIQDQEDLNIKNEIADYDDYNDNDHDEDDLSIKWYMKLSQSQEFHALRKEEIEDEPQEDYFPTFDDLEIDIEKHSIGSPDYVLEKEESFSPQENLENLKAGKIVTKESTDKLDDKLPVDRVDSGSRLSRENSSESSKLPSPEVAEDNLNKTEEEKLETAKNEVLKSKRELRVVIPKIGVKETSEEIFDEVFTKKLEKKLEPTKSSSSKEIVSKLSKNKEKKKWYLKPPVIDAPHLPKGKRKATEELKLNEPTSTKKKPKPTVELASTSSTSLVTAQGSSIHINKSLRTELDKRKKRRNKNVEIYTKDTKLKIQDYRKKKLKEIASKKVSAQSTTEKSTKEDVQKPHTKPKVKVSSGRGLFLTGEEKTRESSKKDSSESSLKKKKTEEPRKEKTKDTSKKKSTEIEPVEQRSKESSLKEKTKESSSKKKSLEKETSEKSKENSLKKKANTQLEEPLAKKKYKIQKKPNESSNKAPPLRKLSFNDLNISDNAEPSKSKVNYPEKPNQTSKKEHPEKPLVPNDKPECSHQKGSAKILKGILMLPLSERVRKEKKSVTIIAEPQIVYIERSPGNNCRKVNSKDAPIPNIKSQSHDEVISTLLCWKPTWLEEQKLMPNSPQVSKRNPMRMLTNFNSVGDYIDIVTPLMLLELWSNVFKDWCHNNSQPKFSFIENIGRKSDGLLCLNCYCLAEREEADNYPKIGDLLIVEYYFAVDNKIATTKKFGYVLSSNKRRISPTDLIPKQLTDYGTPAPFKVEFSLLVNCATNIRIIQEKLIRIRLVSRINSSLRLFKPVTRLRHINFGNLILKPNIKEYKVSKPTQMTSAIEDDLNADQMMCVYEAYQICTRNEAGIYMIQGPPGTGKSFVIKNLVRQLLCDASKNSNLQKHRILLCAPSNGAIDEITKTLIDMRSTLHKNNRFKMIRLGPPNAIHNPIVRSITVPELISKYILTQQNNNLKNNYFINDEYNFLKRKENTIKNILMSLEERNQDCSAELLNLKKVQEQISLLSTNSTYQNRRALEKDAEINYLTNADIICTTLSSCVGSKLEEMVREKKIEFTCCIIDEATQSNEQETLIPLLLNINKFVLVGDPAQLPPTTLSKEAKNLGYGSSLFSRIQSCFEYQTDNPIRMLTHQYRMHPEICKFPSILFYGGKLKSAELVIQRQENILDPCSLFCLNNTLDFKETEYQNKIEADLVLLLTDLITKRTRYNVGIITPYTKQKAYLINKWRTMRSNNKENMEEDRNLSRVVINTVDGFQGQERDVIIISAVRYTSNLFLNDTQRLNVALTRAKHAVYICAHVNLFKAESIWQKLEIEAKIRNFYYLLSDKDVVNERYLSKLLFRQ